MEAVLRREGWERGWLMPDYPSKVYLVGMMGVGKTTVGRLVSRFLGRPYLDSDEQVLAATGYTVPELHSLFGESAYRAQESAALARAATSDVPIVCSVAGGAVLEPHNRHLLRLGGAIVWLRAEVSTMAHRVGRGQGRPLLGEDPTSVLRLLDAVRRPLYGSLATGVVDVDGITPEVACERVSRTVRHGSAWSPGLGPYPPASH